MASNFGWDELRTASENHTLNILGASMTSDEVLRITGGNAHARRPAWSQRELFFQTDGHSDGRIILYPVRPQNGFGDNPYRSPCKDWLRR